MEIIRYRDKHGREMIRDRFGKERREGVDFFPYKPDEALKEARSNESNPPKSNIISYDPPKKKKQN